ncbi:MAG: thioredoxin [Bacillota bacterium]|nr:thioredoxin [Bacillota bacterium]HHU61471.1 thioredoxin [Natronincola sp.]
MLMNVMDDNFKTDILDYSGVSLVDFWAPWCAPCRMLGPIIEELAADYGDNAQVAKLNVDDNQDTARQYGVMSIPTMVIFKDGEEVDRLVGVMPKEQIAERLDKWIA